MGSEWKSIFICLSFMLTDHKCFGPIPRATAGALPLCLDTKDTPARL